MALFKILRGKTKSALDAKTKTDGYCYFVTDDKKFYIDYKDDNNQLQREPLNAKNADTLAGAELETTITDSDTKIPTSKAVRKAFTKVTAKVENNIFYITTYNN